MSIYWKQSLWLGGVYWIVSLVLGYVDTFETYFIDFILSLLLTIFLIPMNFLKPIKWIEKSMRKLPITSTFLVFVGWAPYISVVIFLIASLYGTVVLMSGKASVDGLILMLITPMSILSVIKVACIVFSFILAAFFVFINKKSVIGCLNDKYKLIDGDACDMPVVEEAVAEHTKKMYKCKKEATEKKVALKKEKAKKKEAKKAVSEKKKAEKAIKKKAKKSVKNEDAVK